MTGQNTAAPINRKLLTPGVWVLLVVTAVGVGFGAYRFLFGLQASTNLSQHYPWGIWIVADVSFIALAAGGFVSVALIHVFHRLEYHALARPVLVAALLGYTFACIALFADLGKYYNIWHPLLPGMWQGNSALFEVGMCVMCYLTVLCIEFLPIVCERFIVDSRYPKLGGICRLANRLLGRTMFLFLILGVAISCLHQSSLGHVMVLAPSKLHPLWFTPMLALLFLLSAVVVGFPVAIVVSIYGSWALRLRPDMHMLANLAKYVPFFLSIYLAFKIGDMFIRRSYVYLTEGSIQSTMYVVEILLGLVIPLVMMVFRGVRQSPRWLCVASMLVMCGVIVNRANVYLIGYQPPYTTKVYVPSIAEWGLTLGTVAGVLLCWRVIVTYFPVISQPSMARIA